MAPPIAVQAGGKLPFPPNTMVSIFRTWNITNPYPTNPDTPDYGPVPALVLSRWQFGRYGYFQNLRFTHVALVPLNTDVRDSYVTQQGTQNVATADTVLIFDSVDPTTFTVFFVVMVDIVVKGTPAAYRRAFLDRYQPNNWAVGSGVGTDSID